MRLPRIRIAFDNICAWLTYAYTNEIINGNNNKLSKLFYLALRYQHH